MVPPFCDCLFVEIFVPSGHNDVGILVNGGLNFLHIIGFYAAAFAQNEFLAIVIELCEAIGTFHMHMYRFVLPAIEEK